MVPASRVLLHTVNLTGFTDLTFPFTHGKPRLALLFESPPIERFQIGNGAYVAHIALMDRRLQLDAPLCQHGATGIQRAPIGLSNAHLALTNHRDPFDLLDPAAASATSNEGIVTVPIHTSYPRRFLTTTDLPSAIASLRTLTPLDVAMERRNPDLLWQQSDLPH
ncbi:Aste57867_21477 [Aphanomyces stellatus]|uniref:Aste57867_21477 protein n=1 Tax=Aphanomyces stellatus TaxID=120398 RepID=A0A485LHM6_9STRA|nr:hypothetical protein As57867_021408 [Aphanomyces stellatus]VFT98147.1 Aste57867_21477 [Aphanomyces stellatus]